jgi:hypothetical protein
MTAPKTPEKSDAEPSSFFDFSQRPFAAHMQRGATTVLQSSAPRRCRCGEPMAIHSVTRTYIWYVLPTDSNLRYFCFRCKTIKEFESVSGLILSFVGAAVLGCLLSWLFYAWMHSGFRPVEFTEILISAVMLLFFLLSISTIFLGIRDRLAFPYAHLSPDESFAFEKRLHAHWDSLRKQRENVQAQGDDLLMPFDVTREQVARSDRIVICHPNGTMLTVALPTSAVQGCRLRVKNHGLNKKGHLYIVLNIAS